MTMHKYLHEMTISELLEWRDQGNVEKCEQHIDRLREWSRMLGRRDTHATNFARATFATEIDRVQAVLDSRLPIETERAALAKAHADWCAHIAKPLPLDTEGELHRIAERNVLDRAKVAAYHAFIAAAQRVMVRANLPELTHTWVRACHESADLAAKAADLTDRYWGRGFGNKAVDLAAAQGRSFDCEALGAALFVVAACERETGDAARALFDARWWIISRKLGVEGAAPPDFSRWEKAA